MNVASIAAIIHRLNATLEEELQNIRSVKSDRTRAVEFETAAIARDVEKKIMEMKGGLNGTYGTV
jgi:hypothetical protein